MYWLNSTAPSVRNSSLPMIVVSKGSIQLTLGEYRVFDKMAQFPASLCWIWNCVRKKIASVRIDFGLIRTRHLSLHLLGVRLQILCIQHLLQMQTEKLNATKINFRFNNFNLTLTYSTSLADKSWTRNSDCWSQCITNRIGASISCMPWR